MPTYETTRRFQRDFNALTKEEQKAFRDAIHKFIEDLEVGKGFRNSLHVLRGAEGIFEMTWAPNGRATFQYGHSMRRGEPHVIWRRCGTRGGSKSL